MLDQLSSILTDLNVALDKARTSLAALTPVAHNVDTSPMPPPTMAVMLPKCSRCGCKDVHMGTLNGAFLCGKCELWPPVAEPAPVAREATHEEKLAILRDAPMVGDAFQYNRVPRVIRSLSPAHIKGFGQPTSIASYVHDNQEYITDIRLAPRPAPDAAGTIGRLARHAMDKLCNDMRTRGVTTTMMYDFGCPAVEEAIQEAMAAGAAEVARLRAELSGISGKLTAVEKTVAGTSVCESDKCHDTGCRLARDIRAALAFAQPPAPAEGDVLRAWEWAQGQNINVEIRGITDHTHVRMAYDRWVVIGVSVAECEQYAIPITDPARLAEIRKDYAANKPRE